MSKIEIIKEIRIGFESEFEKLFKITSENELIKEALRIIKYYREKLKEFKSTDNDLSIEDVESSKQLPYYSSYGNKTKYLVPSSMSKQTKKALTDMIRGLGQSLDSYLTKELRYESENDMKKSLLETQRDAVGLFLKNQKLNLGIIPILINKERFNTINEVINSIKNDSLLMEIINNNINNQVFLFGKFMKEVLKKKFDTFSENELSEIIKNIINEYNYETA